MSRVRGTTVVRAVILPALLICIAGCPQGSTTIVPFTGSATQAAKNLDGTYKVTVQGDDQGVIGDKLSIVISGGLFTKLGLRDMTPTDFSNSGSNFVWTSAASVDYGSPQGVVVTAVTLNMNLQADNSMNGTIVLVGGGQTSPPISSNMVKE